MHACRSFSEGRLHDAPDRMSIDGRYKLAEWSTNLRAESVQ